MDNSIAEIAEGLSASKKRMLLVMPLNRDKKWRAIFRHAKVKGWNGMLPFKLSRPTMNGSERLTPLGIAVRKHLESKNG
jgi:hypothetical protein